MVVVSRVTTMSHITIISPSLSLAIGSVPVINALSDLHHPLQTLADLMILQEQFGDLKGRTVTWVGDGSSNVLHDLMLGCAMMGVNVNFCSPSGYEPYYGVLNMAQRLASKSGSTVKVIVVIFPSPFVYIYDYYNLITCYCHFPLILTMILY